MANRTDVLKLLDKPGLTGLEAAKLVLGEAWRRDRGEKKILTDQEIIRIKKTLAPEERDSYNAYVELYQNSWKMISSISGTGLEAEKFILKAMMLLQFVLTDYWTRTLLLETPQIVTEKQYEELKAKQKREASERWTTLIDVLDTVAEELSSEEIQEAWQKPDENGETFVYLTHFLEEAHPDLFRKTIQRVLELIESGQLQPVQLSPEAEQLYKQSTEEIHSWLNDAETIGTVSLEDQQKKARQADRYEASLIEQDASDQGRLSLTRERTISGLKAILASESIEQMSDLDRDLLREEFSPWIRGSQIIQAGLDIPFYDPEGAMAEIGFGGLAIIQKPDPKHLDEKGHYSRDMWDLFLSGSSLLKAGFSWPTPIKAPEAFEKEIETLRKAIKLDLRMYLNIKTVLEGVSEILDIDLLKDLSSDFEETEALLHNYNVLARAVRKMVTGSSLRRSSLEIKLEKLQPTEKSIEQFRRKLSTSLDENFWKKAFDTLKYSNEQTGKETSAREAMAEDSQEMGEAFQKMVERSEA